MTRNRRNLYRILHVQPEAPAEIIRAAYRTLMGPLRNHPDLGGDPKMAALINRAWETLGDPDKRAAYDRTLTRGKGRPEAAAQAAAAAAGKAATSGSAPDAGLDPVNWRADRICPFCRHPVGGLRKIEGICGHCGAPMTMVPGTEPGRKELFGGRTAVRFAKQHDVSLVPAFGARAMRVRLRDLSMTGLSFHASEPLPVRKPIRITDGGIDAVAVVVACRRREAHYVIHAQLLTIKVDRQPGAIMSMQA